MGPGRSNFNPRTREGCDEEMKRIDTLKNHFNPRTREGCDELMEMDRSDSIVISIHAPVKGATLEQTTGKAYNDISIHAPVKGATHR